MQSTTKHQEFYKMIATNRQRGKLYRLRLKDNTTVFVGVPVITAETADRADEFEFRITEPEENRGVIQTTITDIETLEPI